MGGGNASAPDRYRGESAARLSALAIYQPEADYDYPASPGKLPFATDHLAANGWFAGKQMTAADFQMIFPLEAALVRAVLASRYPNICDMVERIHTLPVYQAALENGAVENAPRLSGAAAKGALQ